MKEIIEVQKLQQGQIKEIVNAMKALRQLIDLQQTQIMTLYDIVAQDTKDNKNDR